MRERDSVESKEPATTAEKSFILNKMSRIIVASSLRNALYRGTMPSTFVPGTPKALFATQALSEFEKDMALMKAFHSAATANVDGMIHVDNAGIDG